MWLYATVPFRSQIATPSPVATFDGKLTQGAVDEESYSAKHCVIARHVFSHAATTPAAATLILAMSPGAMKGSAGLEAHWADGVRHKNP